MFRTEVMETKTHLSLNNVCYQAKSIYNRAMFLYKQHYKQTKKSLTYQQLDRKLKQEQCYRVLPAQTAQQTLRLLKRNWKSFYQAQKEFKAHPKRFLGPPNPPKYKPKNGQQVAIFTNQQEKIRNNELVFPKKVPFSLQTRLPALTELREVRIIPRAIGYSIEVVYSKLVPVGADKHTNIGAIDLGIHNLLTYVDNMGNRPIVVKDEGKGIKSVIRKYLKETKKLQKKYAQQQKLTLKKNNRFVYGKTFRKLQEYKRKSVREWVHQMSRKFVNHWIKTGITQVYVGYNSTWKQQLRLRKKTTQMFVILPFDKFIHALKYKAEEH